MSEDKEKLISEAVEKALKGDKEAINGIEDRVTRAKAKAALVKAQLIRQQLLKSQLKLIIKKRQKKNQKLELCQLIAQKIERKNILNQSTASKMKNGFN